MPETLAGLRKFMRSVFLLGPLCGIAATVTHVVYLKWIDAWDPAISLFQALVLLFGISFTFPFSLSLVRMTWFGLNESVRARAELEKTGERLGRFVEHTEEVLDAQTVAEGKEILRDIREFVRPEIKSPPVSPAAALDRLKSFKTVSKGGNGV